MLNHPALQTDDPAAQPMDELYFQHIDKSLIHYKVCDEITYLFINLNGATVEVWEWTSNFILYWVCDYLSLQGLKLFQFSKSCPWLKSHELSMIMQWDRKPSAVLALSEGNPSVTDGFPLLDLTPNDQ